MSLFPKSLLVMILVGALALTSLAAQHSIAVQNYSFTPSTLTIAVGDTVTWTCSQGTHNVHETSASAVFYSGTPRGATWTYTFVFNVPARTYNYQCDLHAPGMAGSVIVEQPNEVPQPVNLSATSFELGQNYPNPFNPTTTIQYFLKNEGLTRLAVYNLQGQLVAQPVNGRQAAGEYRVNFDGAALPSGVYLYRLTSGQWTRSAKMILMK